MSGGSYNYLGIKATNQELAPIPDDLQRMADRLTSLPYATRAAADTAKVIEHLNAAQAHAEKLADVWHAVEWWDSGDWSEDQAVEEIGTYESPDRPAPYALPDRSHLIGHPVTVTLHPWARQGPTAGVFAGQGERGFSLRLVGGGRWTWWHAEVAAVELAAEQEGPGQPVT